MKLERLFIDLDDCLINTGAVIEAHKQILLRNGVSPEALAEYFASRGNAPDYYRSRTFYLMSNAEVVKTLFGLNEEQVKRILAETTAFIFDFKRYIYDDAWFFLETFKNDPETEVVLVTVGGEGWQGIKISASGIRPYFKRVAITAGGKKPDSIAQIQSEEGGQEVISYFLDDKGSEVAGVKKAFPDITCIHVNRGDEARYATDKSDSHDYVVKDLREAVNIIKTLS